MTSTGIVENALNNSVLIPRHSRTYIMKTVENALNNIVNPTQANLTSVEILIHERI